MSDKGRIVAVALRNRCRIIMKIEKIEKRSFKTYRRDPKLANKMRGYRAMKIFSKNLNPKLANDLVLFKIDDFLSFRVECNMMCIQEEKTIVMWCFTST